ncbi:MAG: hypothetical protein KGJ78_06545 [Alphaproteobacteria bacterium]|nr:hypothetical protein [Alphaproteobacteria bacterium]
MKRLIAATIGLALLASTPAMAGDWHGRDRYDGQSYRHEDNSGAIVAFGVGLAALAIIASQNHDRDGYYARERYGYGPDYDRRDYDRRDYYQRDYDQRDYGDRHYDNSDDDDE